MVGMDRPRRYIAMVFSLVLAALPGSSAGATEIYRWTDENGVVHFSQTAPQVPEADVDRMALSDNRPSDFDPDADIYNVEAQQERMQSLREEMEQKREDRLEQQRWQARQEAEAEARRREYELRNRNYPVYYIPPIRPVRPVPPIERPPPGPGDPIRPPGTIKPPRPIVPGLDDTGGGS